MNDARPPQSWGAADVAVLGVGLNGHLGFIEPAETLAPHAHVAKLSTTSKIHPMIQGAPQQPECGLTLGIADLLRTRSLVVIVQGAHKMAVIERLRRPEISTGFPASLLWLHPNVTVFADTAAAPLGV